MHSSNFRQILTECLLCGWHYPDSRCNTAVTQYQCSEETVKQLSLIHGEGSDNKHTRDEQDPPGTVAPPGTMALRDACSRDMQA